MNFDYDLNTKSNDLNQLIIVFIKFNTLFRCACYTVSLILCQKNITTSYFYTVNNTIKNL